MIVILSVMVYFLAGTVTGLSLIFASLPSEKGEELNGWTLGMGVLLIMVALHPVVFNYISNI